LLVVHLLFDYLGYDRFPGWPHLILLSLVQLVLIAGLVGVLFVALRPLESNPVPGWDGGSVPARGPTSAAVGTLLCVAAITTLVSVKCRLKDDGFYCIAVMLAALAAARTLASDNRSDKKLLAPTTVSRRAKKPGD
jgi:hypothetical protein